MLECKSARQIWPLGVSSVTADCKGFKLESDVARAALRQVVTAVVSGGPGEAGGWKAFRRLLLALARECPHKPRWRERWRRAGPLEGRGAGLD